MKAERTDRIKGRPPVVHRAVLRGDSETLSYYGKKGAEAAKKAKGEVKANLAEEDIFYRHRQIAQQDAEDALRAEQNREHIVPINPEDTKEAA